MSLESPDDLLAELNRMNAALGITEEDRARLIPPNRLFDTLALRMLVDGQALNVPENLRWQVGYCWDCRRRMIVKEINPALDRPGFLPAPMRLLRRVRYCPDCLARRQADSNRRAAARRARERAARRESIRCLVCGETMLAVRSSKKFCSTRCRVRAYRASQPDAAMIPPVTLTDIAPRESIPLA